MSLIQSLATGTSPKRGFWGEMAPCAHVVQLYDQEGAFMDALDGFVSGGIEAGDGVVVIATSGHRIALEARLQARGIDLQAVTAADRYIALDAASTLGLFMQDGWPNEERFHAVVAGLLARARGTTARRVRAFGEMVAIMWARGEHGATVRLEHLWHKLCQTESFSLLCAYPKAGFTQDSHASIEQICSAHSHVLP